MRSDDEGAVFGKHYAAIAIVEHCWTVDIEMVSTEDDR